MSSSSSSSATVEAESRGGDPSSAPLAPNALAGKVALVTGASRGIGRGIALGLGEAGATVYATGRSDEVMRLTRAFATLSGKCVPVQCDHASGEQVQQLFARISRENDGRLDVLVNNAYPAVSSLTENASKKFWEKPLDMFERVNRVGLQAHYEAAVYATQMMMKRRGGAAAAAASRSASDGLIVNVSSWGSLMPLFDVAYGVGKHAIDRMTAEMARELRPYNIHCVSLWPGMVATNAMATFARDTGALPRDAHDPTTLYNGETTLFQGRATACIAAAPRRALARMSGRVVVSAELARRYGFRDEFGRQPRSMRSVSNTLGASRPWMRGYLARLPAWCDVSVPWSVMKLTLLAAPQFW